MALIVTLGAADADAFISQEYFIAYAAAQGWDLAPYLESPDNPLVDQAIRRGTRHISNDFGYKGYKANGRPQALAWPRTEVVDAEGYDVDYEVIPTEVEQATAEASWYELQNPGALAPVTTQDGNIKREKIGPLETEYFGAAKGRDARPIITSVNALLGGLIASTARSSMSAPAVRG